MKYFLIAVMDVFLVVMENFLAKLIDLRENKTEKTQKGL